MKSIYFDIALLIDLVQQQAPEYSGVVDQLATVSGKLWLRKAYITLDTSSDKINETLVLDHPSEGTIVIDLLADGKIKGIELLSLI